MLPVSIGQDGKARLDWNAGLPGAIKSAATLPGDIATGKTTLADPATQQRAIAAGSLPAVDAGGLTSVLRTPEQGELAAAAKGGYDTAANLGVNYTTGGIHSIGDTIKQSWKNGGVTPSNSKGNWDQLNAMLTQHTDTGVFPIQSLEQQRQAFNGLLMSKEPKDRQGARLAIDAIDDFYENPGKFVDSGPADQAGQILKTARANAAAGYRADRFGNQAAAAEAAGEAPTGDYTKSFQSRMRWMSDPRYPARLAGFSDDEKAAIGAAAKPSASQKVVSIANSMLGEKGMLGLALEHAAGPIGLAAGWIGAPMVKGALEAAANRATSGSFQNIDRMIRQRSPLYTSGAQGVEPKFHHSGQASPGTPTGSCRLPGHHRIPARNPGPELQADIEGLGRPAVRLAQPVPAAGDRRRRYALTYPSTTDADGAAAVSRTTCSSPTATPRRSQIPRTPRSPSGRTSPAHTRTAAAAN